MVYRNRRKSRLAMVPLILCLGSIALAQAPSPARQAAPETAAITAVLDAQVQAWNRGDIDQFATGYKNSPDILFIGRDVRHGYAGMLAGYHANFRTRASMGTLRFSGLEVQSLDARFATVTGQFHLDRSAAAGGNQWGHFLLVMEKTSAGWKIVRDDTSDDAPSPARR